GMYIRRVRTHNKSTGESYETHRLVRSERAGKRVRQLTLLNLGIHASWRSLREILRIQRRSTSSFNTRGGRILSVRKASRPEAQLARLYDALALDHYPGGIRKTFHSS
ncbi:MAG: hypothetical protein ACT4P3_06225, partial [Betaproteobacteria bacterium]